MIPQQPGVRQAKDDVEYADAILDRLVEQYLAGSPLPGTRGQLSIVLFHRLYRYVMAEGYGES